MLHFYAHPEAPFPSGQLPLELLESRQIQTRQRELLEIEKDGATREISMEHLARWEDFSTDLLDLVGDFLSVGDTPIYTLPSHRSRLLGTLPAKVLLKPKKWIGEWVQVSSPLGDEGFAQANSLLHRIDLSSHALLADGQWHRIERRHGERVYLENGKSPRLTDLRGLLQRPQEAILLQALGDWSRRDRVRLKNTQQRTWAQSRVPGHGTVWWQKPTSLNKTPRPLSTEQILRRPLFASLSLDDNRAIVSSRGLYRTLDGENWSRIAGLGEQNLPLARSPRGHIYAGPYISRDGGLSFEEYVRWDRLTAALQEQLRRPPLFLRIQSIEAKDFYVELRIDTGFQLLRARQLYNSDSWTVVR